MSNTNTGGPAFPSKKRVYRAGYATAEFEPVDGMDLRDYFAAKCMQGLSALPPDFDNDRDTLEMVAKIAYEQADAMLKVRNK